jgi:hypothetical protein
MPAMKICGVPSSPVPTKASMEPSDETAYRVSANRGSAVSASLGYADGDRMMASGSGVISPLFRSIT